MAYVIQNYDKRNGGFPKSKRNGKQKSAIKKAAFDYKELASGFRKDMEIFFEIYRCGRLASVFGTSKNAKYGDKHYKFYVDAQELAYLLGKDGIGTLTGGGTGVMQAANIGALKANAVSIGVQPHSLKHEKADGTDGTKRYSVNSMPSRKMIMSASGAMAVFPGGFGTLDELFEYLTQMQIGIMRKVPVILMYRKFWEGLFDWLEKMPIAKGMIEKQNLSQVKFAESPEEAAKVIREHGFENQKKINSEKMKIYFAKDLEAAHDALKHSIEKPTVTVLGSSKIKSSGEYYAEALRVGMLLASEQIIIFTGGGPGVMEAVHIGADKEGRESFRILPDFFKQMEDGGESGNMDIPTKLMASRKLVLASSDGFLFFPGGLGTLDEKFEFLVRMQVGDLEKKPVVSFSEEYWKGLFEWLRNSPLEYGFFTRDDLGMVKFASNGKQAVRMLEENLP